MAPSNANLSGGPASSDGFPGPTSLPANSNGAATPNQQHRVAAELQVQIALPKWRGQGFAHYLLFFFRRSRMNVPYILHEADGVCRTRGSSH